MNTQVWGDICIKWFSECPVHGKDTSGHAQGY